MSYFCAPSLYKVIVIEENLQEVVIIQTGDAGECVYDSVVPFVDVTAFLGHQQLSTKTEDPSSPPINIPDGVIFGDTVALIPLL